LNPINNEEKMKSYASDILESLAYLHERGRRFLKKWKVDKES